MDITAVPTIDPPLRGRPPVHPLEDFGPDWIDAETVRAMLDQIQLGTIRFAYDPAALVEQADDAYLDSLFVTYLRKPQLSSPFALQHRVLALTRAIKTLVDANPNPDAANLVDAHTAEIASTALELWLNQAADALPGYFSPDQRTLLKDHAFSLSSRELAKVTGISVQALQQYRERGQGPRYVQTGPTKVSVRYPVAAVIGWLYGFDR